MKILWLTPALPCPTTGNRSRQFNLIRQLAKRHEITVLSFASGFETQYVSIVEKYCSRVLAIPLEPYLPPGRWANRLKTWRQLLFDPRPAHVRIYPMHRLATPLRQLLGESNYDLVQVELLHSALLRRNFLQLPTILSTQNVESKIQERQFEIAHSPSKKIAARIELFKLQNYEPRVWQSFKTILAVSPVDAREIESFAPDAEVVVVPNGVDCAWFSTPELSQAREHQEILFVGTLSYAPNVDGLRYFCQEIWPRIRQVFPELSLTVVGANPSEAVMVFNNIPGVKVVGFVDDIRPFFWNSQVMIVPLRVGGGTRLKILEAMAAGLPVISTTIGAEGLDVVNGKDLLLADTPDDFTQAVYNLIKDRTLAQNLSQNGRLLVEEKYEWQAIAQKLDQAYQGSF